jgi:hypothetical protein
LDIDPAIINHLIPGFKGENRKISEKIAKKHREPKLPVP